MNVEYGMERLDPILSIIFLKYSNYHFLFSNFSSFFSFFLTTITPIIIAEKANIINIASPLLIFYSFSITTAVPYASISAAPAARVDVEKRTLTMALAPIFVASSLILYIASSRPSANNSV